MMIVEVEKKAHGFIGNALQKNLQSVILGARRNYETRLEYS
ncbi:MAG TPA: hypothetical protein PKV67_16470 [Hyphomonas sp.]|nr:hypothetical protein [Hyphomonas sp.]